ncbi:MULTISPECIES: ATP-binding protein [unclassified Crossiella]|uniref:ATP-binding protein n=1 Tax=Crossiella sp. CA-258035 TaxID=2981138 RepID=UPI0024BD525F|nr:ATP-binding protein [Crossiella sp. CA-258035]WHT17320.1 ATP-binding protein [Crossiella sp. CA-258035]
MTPQTAQVDDIQLVALPTAVNCADLFAQFTLREWSLRPLLEEASTAAGQLVAAVVESADPKRPGMLTVRLRVSGDSLVIEVADGRPAEATPDMEGPNLGVVALDRGRMLWCELPLPGGVTAEAVPLPRRERRRSPEAERLANDPHEVDPEVMERLLTGLSRVQRN